MSAAVTRSANKLRKDGFIVANVEKWIPIPGKAFKVTRDAFGFGDLLIAGPNGWGAALVQVTDSSSITARIKKIQGIAKDTQDLKQVKDALAANENAVAWLRAGNRIFVHGWGKYKLARGGKACRWRCNEIEITLEHFA